MKTVSNQVNGYFSVNILLGYRILRTAKKYKIK